MSGPLKLKCTAAPSDWFDIKNSEDGCVLVQVREGSTCPVPASAYLSADDARKLFNWLGVWLHGGNRS